MGLGAPAERNELPPPDVKLPPRRLVEQLSRDYGQIPVLGLPFADPPTSDNMATKPTPGAVVSAFSRNTSTAPAYWCAGGLWMVLADGAATDGSYCMFSEILPKGPAAPPHVHAGMDEVFYILDGEADFLLGARRQEAAKGSLIFVPKGTVHGFAVPRDTIRLLNLYTPAGFERMITELGEPTNHRELPPAGWRPPEVSQQLRKRVMADTMSAVAVPNPFRN